MQTQEILISPKSSIYDVDDDDDHHHFARNERKKKKSGNEIKYIKCGGREHIE